MYVYMHVYMFNICMYMCLNVDAFDADFVVVLASLLHVCMYLCMRPVLVLYVCIYGRHPACI